MVLVLRKRRLITVFFFGVCCFITYLWLPEPEYEILPATAKKGPLAGKTICLDPGHGGRDPGAVFGVIREKDLNLDIARKLAAFLNQQGAKVVLTRSGDRTRAVFPVRGSLQRAELRLRARLPSITRSHLLISIHCNSEARKVYNGPQTFYQPEDNQGARLARKIQQELGKLRPTNRRAQPGDYYLLQNSTVPRLLWRLVFYPIPGTGNCSSGPIIACVSQRLSAGGL